MLWGNFDLLRLWCGRVRTHFPPGLRPALNLDNSNNIQTYLNELS